MIKLTVMYPNGSDTKFDIGYYKNKHLPMVAELLGNAAKKIEFEIGLGSAVPGEPAPYVGITHITFESLKTFQGSFGSNAKEIKADGPNYTNVSPIIQISEIVLG